MRSVTLAPAQPAAPAPKRGEPPAPAAAQPAAATAPQPAAVPAETPAQQSAAITAAQLARAAALEAPAPAAPEVQQEQRPGSAGEEEIQSLLEQLQEAGKKAKEMREKLKLPKNARQYGEAAIEAYMRLRRARTDSQVSAAAGYARRKAAQLQSSLHSDSENAPRIRAAIRSLQSAAAQASRKKRELAEEQRAEVRAKRAEEEKRQGKAARIRAEQNRRKAARFVRESGNVRGAVLDHMQQEYLAAQRADAAARAEEVLGSAAPAAVPASPAPDGAAVTPVAAAPAVSAPSLDGSI